MKTLFAFFLPILMLACSPTGKSDLSNKSAKDLLGNPDYPGICYGGYREKTRDAQPTVEQIKEDVLLLHALGFRIARTYNTKLPHAENLLKAIKELKQTRDSFEMYVMLGAWIQCEGAFTQSPNHSKGDSLENAGEVERAIKLAQEYPDLVKVLAIGNESMVHWAASYFVEPKVVLKWVNYVQNKKKNQELPASLWVTSSDNFASWGGGTSDYHKDDLNALIQAVDYVSLHTYPMHDTHYNPDFWGPTSADTSLSKKEQIAQAMNRALKYAADQVERTESYVTKIAENKPVHIGETGWASASNGYYGPDGSKACDEYKQGIYYHLINDWSKQKNKTCFYFEGFDEVWKDGNNPGGSENHFGLFTIDGKAKYVIWDALGSGGLAGLTRDGNRVTKTYRGNLDSLLKEVDAPELKTE